MTGEMHALPALERGFRLGPWRVRPHHGALERGLLRRRRERIEPKAMQVLLQLAATPGRYVSKDRLFETVWTERAVTDDCLTRAVHSLRQALGDDAREPRYIETRNGVGYRLIAEVRTGRRREASAAAALAGLALALLAWAWNGDPPARAPVTAGVPGLPQESRDAWLHARYLLARGGEANLRAALEGFSTLAAAYPGFAAAELGRAEAGLELFKLGAAGPDALRDAKAAALRAHGLGDEGPALLRCLGQVTLFLDWDFAAAEALYRRAIEVEPADAVARTRLAWLLVAQRRYREAAVQIEHIRLIDPLHYASEGMAVLLLYSDQVEAAIAEFERLDRTTELGPVVLRIMATAYWKAGRQNESRETLLRAWDGIRPLAPGERNRLAGLTLSGLHREMLAAEVFDSPIVSAGLRAMLGDAPGAIADLELAAGARAPQILYIGAYPELRGLGDEPGFRALLARIGAAGDEPRLAAADGPSPHVIRKHQENHRESSGRMPPE